MLLTAAEIARSNGLDPKRYRQALRDAELPWYVHGARWTVEAGSPEHRDMLRVLEMLLGRSSPSRFKDTGKQAADASDEAYVIGLCDEFLGHKAIRQHRFDFLRGDPGRLGQGTALPVDAWYPELALVIEYRERQHSEAVPFFDRKHTVSGVGRNEQRKLYDQRRRDVLPAQGIMLVEFDFHEFRCNSNGRLVRCDADRQTIAAKLRDFIR